MARTDGYEYKPHTNAEARKRSAVSLVKLLLQKNVDILPEHREECLNIALWKITEAESTHKHRTRFCSAAALTAPKDELRHDHVFQRAVMVKELISCQPEQVDLILGRAVACTITKQEHVTLNKHKQLDGWDRYKTANISVIDTISGDYMIPGEAIPLA
jgi:hypothetical protein